MTQPEAKEIVEVIRTGLRRLYVATAILYIVMGLGGFYVWRSARNTKAALCTYRADLVVRSQQSIQFLREHPDGIGIIPVKTLIDSINNQQHAINALSHLNCSDVSTQTPTPTPSPISTRTP